MRALCGGESNANVIDNVCEVLVIPCCLCELPVFLRRYMKRIAGFQLSGEQILTSNQ